tara:strand:+ start:1267 stop:1455 length:189 start_codon:yes stop_codon:yes gene_type:complete
MNLPIAKLIVLKNLEYCGSLTKGNLGISVTLIDLVLESLLEENLIEINGIFVTITSNGLNLF